MHAVQRQALATFLALACLCTAAQGATALLVAPLLDFTPTGVACLLLHSAVSVVLDSWSSRLPCYQRRS